MRTSTIVALLCLLAAPALAQQTDSSRLTVSRIYGSSEFNPQSFGPARWLEGGKAYTTLEKPDSGKGKDLVRYESATGARTVLVPAARLVPAGDSVPLEVQGYQWSPDRSRLLVYTNSKRVWRQNTRGDYWVLDLGSWKLRRLGGPDAEPSTLMFAKFSPDGNRVGYVRAHDLYVEDLAGGAITRLTRDGSRTIINGTFDWVYEEELDLRDGWRWSPDGRHIAFWQLNADSVRNFDLIDNTDSLYSYIVPVQYPKAGESNSAARIGVVNADGAGETRWLDLPGDPRNHYPARMDWAANSSELYVQQLNRLQDTLVLFLADAASGPVRPILTEGDSTWVELVDPMVWLEGGKRFLWLSERDGWNHAYLGTRESGALQLLTPGSSDLLGVEAVDTTAGWLYYLASPDNQAQRYLYRVRLNGKGKPERVTPRDQTGVNGYDISPDGRWAFHTWSSFGHPPVLTLVRLPQHRVARTLVANDTLRARLDRLQRGSTEFFQVAIDSGIRLNGYLMKPADFDSTKQYPILFQVYGGPGSQTVVDSWGGQQYLWHLMLTQKGYLVASVDNRGTGARGRDWRKIIHGHMGVVESHDQGAAARAISRWSFVDSSRVGIWGWSYGGFMTLNAIFRHPDVYRMAVAVAPVTYWRFYDDVYTERYNGLPQTNLKGYREGSPLGLARQLKGDLLVIHGSGDDNVHYQNTQTLVDSLVAAGKPFQMMEYPNRTHSISGGNTRVHLFQLITGYIEEHLGGE